MSTKLKLGAGNWATKAGSLLSYNDEGGNFKPLPFTFTRSTSGTRVNKDGLIEVVTNNKPRIDFLNDSNGALLLEPARTNLLTYSEAFDNAYWTKIGSSVVSGFVSPKGDLSAFKLVEDTSFGDHRVNSTAQTLTANTYSGSFFAKKSERDVVQIFTNGVFDANAYANFDLANGVVSVSVSTTAKIELLSDGWYKCSYTFIGTAAVAPSMYISILTSPTSVKSEDYQGDGTSGIYIWGTQLEVGSYATSYIPTQGAIATRVVDACSQTPPSGIIGQTEGTIFVQIGGLSKEADGYILELSDNSNTNRIILQKNISDLTDFRLFVQSSGGPQINLPFNGSFSDNSKIAIAYANNDYNVYVNGVSYLNGSSLDIPTCNKISVGNRYNNTSQYGNGIKEVKLYNTRLSNAELQALTSN